MSHFFLEAFEHVHKDRAAEYEELSRQTDLKVKETEPGMLIHAQTKVLETDDKIVYRWQETFSSYAGFEAHITNPHTQKHIEALNNGLLCAPLEVVIYCDWTDEQKAPWLAVEGISLRFAELVNGYYV